MRGLPGARVELLDLPEHVLRRVLLFVHNPFNLLFTCKAILPVAGETLYARVNFTGKPQWGGDGAGKIMDDACLHDLVSGLENDTKSARKPFGRDLKLSFLRHITELRHAFGSDDQARREKRRAYDDEGWYDEPERSCRSTENDHRKLIQLFGHLYGIDVEPFPGLRFIDFRYLYRQSWDSPPKDFFIPTALSFIQVFAAIILPEKFDIPLGLLRGPRDFSPPLELRFAGGHAPEAVTHYFGGSPFIFDLPMVCHGAQNKVALSLSARGTSTPADRTRVIGEAFCKVLRAAHPELFPPTRGSRKLSPKELEKRSKTRWVFLDPSFDEIDDGMEYLMLEKDVLQRKLEAELPQSLVSRVEFETHNRGTAAQWYAEWDSDHAELSESDEDSYAS
ncbi:hypothetical protein IAT38_007385 [Cryptococcus sp. DSM 104549]